MSSSDKAPRQKSRGEVASSRVLSGRSEVETFLQKVAATPAPARQAGTRGRLIFALDATASRQPTWDRAMHLQGEMFHEASRLGGLDIQLVFYRGFGECKASRWHSDGKTLLRAMTAVNCLAGQTQIARVLRHAIKETKQRRVDALVFIGDCVEEDVDELGHMAGQLGLLGVPCFIFHEGQDPSARTAFEQMAKLSGGACCAFDPNSAQELRDLLSAVAVYASGGRQALLDFSQHRGGRVPQLTHQLR